MRLNRLILLWLALSAPVLAADRDQPIHVQADRVTIDEQRRVSTYEGRVILTQGSLQVTASRVEAHRGDKLDRLIATGSPVTVVQKPRTGPELKGSAQRVEYVAAEGRLELSGDARVWRGNDEFSGPRIIYEAEKNLVRALGGEGNGDGRVRATIHPRSDKP